MAVSTALVGEFSFGFATRRPLTALRGVVVFSALFAAVFPPRRFTLLLIRQVRVQFVSSCCRRRYRGRLVAWFAYS